MLIKVHNKNRDICCEQIILLSQICWSTSQNQPDLSVDTAIPSQLTARIGRLSEKQLKFNLFSHKAIWIIANMSYIIINDHFIVLLHPFWSLKSTEDQ